MEDLLQPQVEQSFRLAMPEGLKDLMCDISREVLRAKPENLYQFITDYLEALLLARDTLCNACKVCGDVCHSTCQPELDDELRKLGLDGEDLETAKNVVFKHFDKGNVREADLMTQLLKKTDIDINLLEDIQMAVRAAFLKHERRLRGKVEKSDNPAQIAAQKTLEIYEKELTEEEEEQRNAAAIKIQAAFRGYLIKSSLNQSAHQPKEPAPAEAPRQELKKSSRSADEMDLPMITVDPGTPRTSTSTSRPGALYGRLSSTSLAGSFIHLPKHIPYSVHDITYVDFEEREKQANMLPHHDQDKKKIIFHEKDVLHEIDSGPEEENDEEVISEDISSDSTSVDSDDSVEDMVHNVTYESEDRQIDNTDYTEENGTEAILEEQDDMNEGANKVVSKYETHNENSNLNNADDSDKTLTKLYDKTKDDDISDDRDDNSMLFDGIEKKEDKQRYAEADDEMMETLKEKLMKLSSSNMVQEK